MGEERESLIIKAKPSHEESANHIANFFRKLGHDVKVVGETAIEIPIEIVFAESGMGGDQ